MGQQLFICQTLVNLYLKNGGNLISDCCGYQYLMFYRHISGCKRNFSSTVSTVYRTCAKISSSTEAPSVNSSILIENLKHFKTNDMEARCLLCKNFLDYHDSEAFYATEYSRFVSLVSENPDNAEQTMFLCNQCSCLSWNSLFIKCCTY